METSGRRTGRRSRGPRNVRGGFGRCCLSAAGAVAIAVALAPPSAEANEAPVVDQFSASTACSITPESEVVLTLSAHDPDCAGACTIGCGAYIRYDLTAWSASGGAFTSIDNGASGSPYTATATWQAPASEGTYTISVQISDSGTFICDGRQTTTVELIVNVAVSPNCPPIIASLTADPQQFYPGGSSQLECSASDPDGDAFSYSWNADSGTVTPGTDGAASFDGDEPAVATVTCTVTDSFGAAASREVRIVVSDALAVSVIRSGLATPQRLAVDSMGDLYVVDRGGGGISVVNLFSGAFVYRIPLPDVTTVAVDWADRLLVGRVTGAVLMDRWGGTLLELAPGAALGAVADVAVDKANRRYGVLHGTAGRVVVYGEAGGIVGGFGSTGDGPGQLRNPQGLAVTPDGDWVVADTVHGLVKVFDLGGTLLRSFGGLGAGAGEFVQLDHVAVNADGVVFASDAFQSRVQSFNPDGNLREVLGSYGDGASGFKTPAGILAVDAFRLLVVASLNTPGLQVFRVAGLQPAIPAPAVAVSTDTIAFGNQLVGTVSPPRVVTLTNTGTAPLGLSAISLSGDFAQANACAPFLDPGDACAFEVSFAPTAPGPRPGTLRIATSSAAGVVTVALVGNGLLPPALVLSPAQLGFPDQPVFTVSGPLAVTLTNTGTVAVSIAGISAHGEYEQVNSCGSGLGPGASCTVLVSFAPVTIADDILGSVQIDSTAVGSPHTVLLDGRGTGLDLSATPAVLDFGSVAVGDESDPRAVTVRNAGSEFAQVAQVGLAGASAGEFRLVDDGCSAVLLMRDQACLVTVSFAPGAGGEARALLSVVSNALGSPDTVELVGVARQEAGEAIPTLSEWGLILLALALAGAGLALARGRAGL